MLQGPANDRHAATLRILPLIALRIPCGKRPLAKALIDDMLSPCASLPLLILL